MPEPTEDASPPLRTWRPMAAWTAGILLALGLVWGGAKTVRLYRTHQVFSHYGDYFTGPRDEQVLIADLGGREAGLSRCREYISLPTQLIGTENKLRALTALGFHGEGCLPILQDAMHSGDALMRVGAVRGFCQYLLHEDQGLQKFSSVPRYQEVIDVIKAAQSDSDLDVRSTAADALRRITDQELPK